MIIFAGNWKKPAFKLSTEGPILLVLVNSSQIFSEELLVIKINKVQRFPYNWSNLMAIWFMMKPIMHLCIEDLESVWNNPLIFTKPSITLLNLISHLNRVTTVLTYECWSYHALGLAQVWVSDYLENVLFEKMTISYWSLFSKGNCDSNIILSAKKSWRFHYFFKKINNVLAKNFAFVN